MVYIPIFCALLQGICGHLVVSQRYSKSVNKLPFLWIFCCASDDTGTFLELERAFKRANQFSLFEDTFHSADETCFRLKEFYEKYSSLKKIKAEKLIVNCNKKMSPDALSKRHEISISLWSVGCMNAWINWGQNMFVHSTHLFLTF